MQTFLSPPLAFEDNISSKAHWMKMGRNCAASELLSLAGSSVAEPEVLSTLHWDGLLSRPCVGYWRSPSLKLPKTYIIDPEVSAGPVVLLILRDHLYGDISISDGFFCEWPVVVTFYLRQK